MEKILFLDIKDGELGEYLFVYKKGKYESLNIKNSYFSLEGDFPNFTINNINTCISLPLNLLNFRVLELPFHDKSRINEILRFDLEGIILDDISNIIFDSVILDRVEDRYKVLVIFIEKQRLRSILTKLNAKGIDPFCITSIEVRNIVKDFDIDKILNPISLKNEGRIEIAKEELKAPTINLRKDEFVFKREFEKEKKAFKVSIILLILLFSLNLINFFINFMAITRESKVIKNDIRKMYQGLFPQENNIFNEIYQIKSHIRELEEKENVFVSVSPLEILMELSRLKRNGLVVSELAVEKNNIIIKGESYSLSIIQDFRDGLNKIYRDVNISDSKELVQGKMAFTIIARR
jgi:type II secretory pathway component PulL